MPAQNLTPNWTVPVVDRSTGLATQSWFEFFAGLTARPGPIATVALTASPFTFTASVNGQLAVSGGTVSSITIGRARVTGIDVGFTNGLIPVAQGDAVTITYSASPSISFIPA